MKKKRRKKTPSVRLTTTRRESRTQTDWARFARSSCPSSAERIVLSGTRKKRLDPAERGYLDWQWHHFSVFFRQAKKRGDGYAHKLPPALFDELAEHVAQLTKVFELDIPASSSATDDPDPIDELWANVAELETWLEAHRPAKQHHRPVEHAVALACAMVRRFRPNPRSRIRPGLLLPLLTASRLAVHCAELCGHELTVDYIKKTVRAQEAGRKPRRPSGG